MRSSNPLDIRTATATVQQALVDALDLAFRHRYPAAADLQALVAYAAQKLPDRALVLVESEGVVYRWATASQLVPAPPFVVSPLQLPPTGNGRWVRQSSSVTLGPTYLRPVHRVPTGYARAVQIYQGEDDDVLERIYAQRPAFLVEWVSDDYVVKSNMHGSIYEVSWHFIVHCLARNLRNGPQAVVGSEVTSDTEPGLLRMIGDVRYLLGGCTLGLDPGVKFCDVTGAARIAETDLAQRLFRAELDVTVRGSVHVVDEDLLPHAEIWVSRYDAGTPQGEPFDPENFVAAGHVFEARGAPLWASCGESLAYLNGQPVQTAPGSRVFDDDADTYRDLAPSGALTFWTVRAGADPPPLLPGALRIGCTQTRGGRVAADVPLCCYARRSGANPGDPFRAA